MSKLQKSPFLSRVQPEGPVVQFSSTAQRLFSVSFSAAALALVLSGCSEYDNSAIPEMPSAQEVEKAKVDGDWSTPAYASKEDCEAAVSQEKAPEGKVGTCESVESAGLIDFEGNTKESLRMAEASASGVSGNTLSATNTHTSHSSGISPWIYYWMLSNNTSSSLNRSAVASTLNGQSVQPVRPMGFLNMDAKGKTSFTSTPSYNLASHDHLSGIGANGGLAATKTAKINGTPQATTSRIASYKSYSASRSSTASVSRSSGRSVSVGRSGGGGGGGG